MADSDSRRKEWILAASELARDPTAKVRCPDCGTLLSTEDEKAYESHVDRHIFCKDCGAGEWVLINTTLKNIQ